MKGQRYGLFTTVATGFTVAGLMPGVTEVVFVPTGALAGAAAGVVGGVRLVPGRLAGPLLGKLAVPAGVSLIFNNFLLTGM